MIGLLGILFVFMCGVFLNFFCVGKIFDRIGWLLFCFVTGTCHNRSVLEHVIGIWCGMRENILRE